MSRDDPRPPPTPPPAAVDIHVVDPATVANRPGSAETASEGAFVPPEVDEAGTPPEDRRFRPDIEGLRAVAVLLVVLDHARVPFFSAGFIGVDVFFVISGFVITGLLLRQASAVGTPSLSWFYGRRVRRIVPTAMFVIVVTVALERLLIGSTFAADVAHDGRWASVFLANFTPAHGGNIYKPSPAPFGNYWSLAVEEQFYLIYPLCFVAVVSIASRRSARIKVGVFLGVVAASSFVFSVYSSRGIGTFGAYVSPFTRAWELAVGGLVAVGAVWFRRFPAPVLAAASWSGLGLIVYGSHVITGSHGGYPGYIAAMPVLATALLIAAGTPVPRWGAESVLRLAPFKYLGRWSYSIYLWHYPILVLAAQRWGALSLTSSLLLAALAVAVSAGTYYAIENPIRHWAFLDERSWASIGGGLLIVAIGLALLGTIA